MLKDCSGAVIGSIDNKILVVPGMILIFDGNGCPVRFIDLSKINSVPVFMNTNIFPLVRTKRSLLSELTSK